MSILNTVLQLTGEYEKGSELQISETGGHEKAQEVYNYAVKKKKKS